MGFQMLLEKQVMGEEVVVFSDSKELKSVSSCKFSIATAFECSKNLETSSRENKVSLACVRGHSEDYRNEKADELARKGSGTRFLECNPVLGCKTRGIKGKMC